MISLSDKIGLLLSHSYIEFKGYGWGWLESGFDLRVKLSFGWGMVYLSLRLIYGWEWVGVELITFILIDKVELK